MLHIFDEDKETVIMRAVVQRVKESSVSVGDQVVGKIGRGLMVLLGVKNSDADADASYLAEKIIHLRIFEDEAGKMNKSLIDVKGEMLVVSQFTLMGDCRKGRRPSFATAAAPETANRLYEAFITHVRGKHIPVSSGRFQAMMDVSLINSGPVTLIIESNNH